MSDARRSPQTAEPGISPLTWIALLAIVAAAGWLGWEMSHRSAGRMAPVQPAAAPAPEQAPAAPANDAPVNGGGRLNG